MQLSRSVEYTDYIRPVCLPEQGSELEYDYECWLTGWGRLRGGGEYNTIHEGFETNMALWTKF